MEKRLKGFKYLLINRDSYVGMCGHVCNCQCKAFELEIIGTETQLRFRMDLVQTAIGKSQGIKAARRCTARHSLLCQYIDYTEDGARAYLGVLVGKENLFGGMGKIMGSAVKN